MNAAGRVRGRMAAASGPGAPAHRRPEGACTMGRFVIEPHFRLQEWVAEEKGYFRAEGLDYVFRELVQATDGQIHNRGDRIGAYQSLEAGR